MLACRSSPRGRRAKGRKREEKDDDDDDDDDLSRLGSARRFSAGRRIRPTYDDPWGIRRDFSPPQVVTPNACVHVARKSFLLLFPRVHLTWACGQCASSTLLSLYLSFTFRPFVLSLSLSLSLSLFFLLRTAGVINTLLSLSFLLSLSRSILVAGERGARSNIVLRSQSSSG